MSNDSQTHAAAPVGAPVLSEGLGPVAPKRDRATSNPGGCECNECGAIFIGGPEHELCAVCVELFDKYGNPLDGSSLPNCCFPDCGCDGSRNCMAESGANFGSCALNYERGTKFGA